MGIMQLMFKASFLLLDYTSALSYGRELLGIYRKCGEIAKEGDVTLTLAKICEKQFEYVKSRELYEKAMTIMIEIGDRKREAYAYEKFGFMSYFIGEYDKAKEYLEKALAIIKEIGDKEEAAAAYGKLGTVFQVLGEYDNAKDFLEEELAIRIKIGDRVERQQITST